MVFDVKNFLLLFTVSINFGLSYFIFLKGRKVEINRVFAFILFLIAVWAASFFYLLNSDNESVGLLLRRLTPVTSSFIAGYLLYFSIIFPTPLFVPNRIFKFFCIAPGFIFSFASLLTPFMIKSYGLRYFHGKLEWTPVFGKLYIFFVGYFIIYLLISLSIFIWKTIRLSGIDKIRMFYVLFGIGVSAVTATIFSLILPMLGVLDLYGYAPITTLFSAVFISYAIARYQLYNITDFLTKGFIAIYIASLIITMIFLGHLGAINLFFSLFVTISILFLSLFILFRNIKNHANISFAALTFSIFIWNLSVFILRLGVSYGSLEAFLWAKMAFIGSAIIPLAFLYFSHNFPYRIAKINRLFNIAVISVTSIIVIAILKDLVISGMTISGQGYTLTFGSWHTFFIIYFISLFLLAFKNFYVKLKTARGIYKVQIQYIFLGFLLNTLIAVVTNLLLPSLKITAFTQIGPNSTIIFLGIVFYSIIKHRLMNVDIVLQKGVFYASVTAIIMAIYGIVIASLETFLKGFLGYSSLLVSFIMAAIIAVSFQPFISFLQDITSRIFFRSRYDYTKVIREISQKISIQIRIEDLVTLLTSSFIKVLGMSETSLMVIDKDRKKFRSVSAGTSKIEERYKYVEIDENGFSAKRMMQTKDILFIDEIEDEILRQKGLYMPDQYGILTFLENIKEEMTRINATIFVPIIGKGELMGVIFAGPKVDGNTYTAEDINVLLTLSGQIAFALDNIKLYEEVLNIKNHVTDILDAMVTGVLTVDTNGTIATFNPMAEKITGIKAQDALGHNYKDIFGNKGNIVQVIDSTNKGKNFDNYESIILGEKDAFIPVSISSTILRNTQHRKTGVLLTFTNLVEIKKLESKVRQADKINALGTMAAGMAHEIKNPLSAMKVFSQLFPSRYTDQAFRDKLMEIWPREIDRIDKIVESLLGFAKSTSPKFEFVNINEIIDNNVKYFADKAKECSVQVYTEYDDSLPLIEADKEQISQVTSNLILNAIQAMLSGGRLRVRTYQGSIVGDRIHDIKIEVTDTGGGIAEDNLKKLFDPFFTTKHSGTGLGLAITHSVIDSHKGTIEVKTRLDVGTTFTVTLPVKQQG